MSEESPETEVEGSATPSRLGPGDRDATAYLYWGGFLTLLLLALIATVRFYLSASQAISVWVSPDFQPAFQAAFNLAVVLACAVGLSLLVRRMRP